MTTLAEYKRRDVGAGDVGVEIEVEGNRVPEDGPLGWVGVHDGSLRNGREYVFDGPQPIAKVPGLLARLNAHFKKHNTELRFSFRTSVHVHLNCNALNVSQLKAVIYSYLLLEQVLFTRVKEYRRGNRFCLAYENAEGLGHTLSRIFSATDYKFLQRGIQEQEVRYASLGLFSLVRHGSLEVRCMHGTADKEYLTDWVNSLWRMRSNAAELGSVEAVFEFLRENGPREFIRYMLGDGWYKAEMSNLVLRSTSLTYDLYRDALKAGEMIRLGIDLDDYDNFAAEAAELFYED